MKASARRSRSAGASRRAGCWALGLAMVTGAAHAQVAGTLAVDSVNRYRGTGTDDVGPVLRASAMADTPWGAYSGVSGLWRTRDAGLASADAMVGWSGRLNTVGALDTLSPDWGWDAGAHRTHYGGDAHRDFSEFMLGVLAPGATLRTWYAPRYFGGRSHTFYTALDASHAFDEHWHAFGHLGWLHYGPAPSYQARVPDRTDTLVGIGWTMDAWELRLSRDGIAAGHARDGIDARRRRAAWLLGASVAF